MSDCQICPVCQVKIKGDIAMFSHGKPGTKERLFARVCQYVNDKRCLVQEINIENIKPIDFYSPKP